MVFGRLTQALVASLAVWPSSWWDQPKGDRRQGLTPRVVDTSGPKPEWVGADQDSYNQEGKTYYRVVLDNQKNLSRGIELAKNQGFRAVRESVILKIGSAFGMNETYSSNNNDDASSADAPQSAVHTGDGPDRQGRAANRHEAGGLLVGEDPAPHARWRGSAGLQNVHAGHEIPPSTSTRPSWTLPRRR